MSKHNPFQGKWTISKRLKRVIQENGGEMPVEDLLTQMKRQGYLKKPLRRSLEALDVEVTDGMARLR